MKNNKWHPTTEKPTDDGLYLCTMRWRYTTKCVYDYVVEYFKNGEWDPDNDYGDDLNKELIDWDIVAWMPLPKLYKDRMY